MAARYCMNSSRRLLPELLAILIVAIWGMTFISTKVLINSGLLPAQIFSIRFTMAYLGIWIISLARGSGRRFFSATLKDELIFILLGLSGGSMYFLAENTALEYTQASNVSFIVCSTPLITMLLTLLLKKTVRGELVRKLEPVKVSWKLLAGTLLAIGGMALLLLIPFRAARTGNWASCPWKTSPRRGHSTGAFRNTPLRHWPSWIVWPPTW